MKGRRTSRRRSSRALEHNDSMRSLDVSQSASADEDMFEMSTAEHGGDSESEGGRPGRTRSGDSSGENSDDEDEADNDTDNADSRSPGKRLEGKATRRSRGKRRSRTKQQQQRHQNSESASLPEESPTPPHTVQHAAQRSKVSGGTTTSSRAVPAAAAAAAAMDASSTAAQPQDAAVDNTDNTPTATSAAAPEGGPKAAQRDPSPSKTAGSLTHKRTSSGSAAVQLVAEDKVRTHSFAASTTVTFDKSKPSSASTFPATPPPATKPTSQRGADAAKAALASAASAAASTSASSAPVAKSPLSVSVSTARQSSDTTGSEAAHKDAPPAPRPRLTDTVLPLEGWVGGEGGGGRRRIFFFESGFKFTLFVAVRRETDEQFRRRCASLDPGALRRMRQAQAANAAKAAKTAKAAKAAKAAEVSDARKEQTDAKAAEAGDAGSKSAQRHGDPQTAADRDSRPRRVCLFWISRTHRKIVISMSFLFCNADLTPALADTQPHDAREFIGRRREERGTEHTGLVSKGPLHVRLVAASPGLGQAPSCGWFWIGARVGAALISTLFCVVVVVPHRQAHRPPKLQQTSSCST